jgi:predicted ABC-type ATPase
MQTKYLKNPHLFIIAGPNGAGKTTSAMKLLPDLLQCEEYVNADGIASGISQFRRIPSGDGTKKALRIFSGFTCL